MFVALYECLFVLRGYPPPPAPPPRLAAPGRTHPERKDRASWLRGSVCGPTDQKACAILAYPRPFCLPHFFEAAEGHARSMSELL